MSLIASLCLSDLRLLLVMLVFLLPLINSCYSSGGGGGGGGGVWALVWGVKIKLISSVLVFSPFLPNIAIGAISVLKSVPLEVI